MPTPCARARTSPGPPSACGSGWSRSTRSSARARSRPCAAVFDTRVDKVKHWPGSAARKTGRVLHGHGIDLIDHPTSFYVEDVKGPLVTGERERARIWARHLLTIVRTRPATKSA